jgi:phosphoglycerate dehydrogenase-like enzyme
MPLWFNPGMGSLRIYVDFIAPPDTWQVLQEGVRGHELWSAHKPITSVLDMAKCDAQFADADVAFGQPDPRAIESSRSLKWIQVSSSSITRYDTPQFRALMAERHIAVTNSASVYSEACAVHALSFMLAQARNLPAALRARVAGGTPDWNALRESSGTLRGETILILGFGAIGKRLVELLRPFHVNVLAYRRKARGDEGVPVIEPGQLTAALAHADHVMNILPDSLETWHFFNAARFAEIKPGALFYNIGRGATVDQAALLEALRSGRLAAAWLDVTEPEPLPENHPLWREPNCHITPHLAGGHSNEALTLVRHFLENLERFVNGAPLRDRVM